MQIQRIILRIPAILSVDDEGRRGDAVSGEPERRAGSRDIDSAADVRFFCGDTPFSMAYAKQMLLTAGVQAALILPLLHFR